MLGARRQRATAVVLVAATLLLVSAALLLFYQLHGPASLHTWAGVSHVMPWMVQVKRPDSRSGAAASLHTPGAVIISPGTATSYDTRVAELVWVHPSIRIQGTSAGQNATKSASAASPKPSKGGASTSAGASSHHTRDLPRQRLPPANVASLGIRAQSHAGTANVASSSTLTRGQAQTQPEQANQQEQQGQHQHQHQQWAAAAPQQEDQPDSAHPQDELHHHLKHLDLHFVGAHEDDEHVADGDSTVDSQEDLEKYLEACILDLRLLESKMDRLTQEPHHGTTQDYSADQAGLGLTMAATDNLTKSSFSSSSSSSNNNSIGGSRGGGGSSLPSGVVMPNKWNLRGVDPALLDILLLTDAMMQGVCTGTLSVAAQHLQQRAATVRAQRSPESRSKQLEHGQQQSQAQSAAIAKQQDHHVQGAVSLQRGRHQYQHQHQQEQGQERRHQHKQRQDWQELLVLQEEYYLTDTLLKYDLLIARQQAAPGIFTTTEDVVLNTTRQDAATAAATAAGHLQDLTPQEATETVLAATGSDNSIHPPPSSSIPSATITTSTSSVSYWAEEAHSANSDGGSSDDYESGYLAELASEMGLSVDQLIPTSKRYLLAGYLSPAQRIAGSIHCYGCDEVYDSDLLGSPEWEEGSDAWKAGGSRSLLQLNRLPTISSLTARNLEFNCSTLSGLEACAEPQCFDVYTLVRLANGTIICRRSGAGGRAAAPAIIIPFRYSYLFAFGNNVILGAFSTGFQASETIRARTRRTESWDFYVYDLGVARFAGSLGSFQAVELVYAYGVYTNDVVFSFNRQTWFTLNYAYSFRDAIQTIVQRLPVPGFTFDIPAINPIAQYSVFGTTGLPWLP